MISLEIPNVARRGYYLKRRMIVMPNKKAKRRKQERRERDEYLSTHGRTPAQIKRKAKREKKISGRFIP
tara:strand:+ start:174 stop:380 length:207 start_codon:yes stop_codon:yes gene_type:complete